MVGAVAAIGMVGLLRWVHTIRGWRDEASGEDLLVDVGLEQMIESLGFTLNIVGGHQLCLDGNRELVGRVAGEAEALAVVCN